MQISVFYDHIQEASVQSGLSIPEVLTRVHSFGIDALECCIDAVKGKESSMRRMFEAAGLRVSCLYGTFQLAKNPDQKDAYEFIDSAVKMGCDKVLIIPGFVSANAFPFIKKHAMKKMAYALRKLCDNAAKRGITITMEDFDDCIAPFSTDDELVWFMRQVPLLRCTFDTGNFKYQEIDELQAFPKLKDKIVHVHCKDRALTGVSGEISKITVAGNHLYTASVGSGCIHMKEIFDKLNSIGYDNTLAIEHFGAPDQLTYIKQSAAWIRANY